MNANVNTESRHGFLQGVRVLEVGGELVEYCGKLLAGLGADVIKVEPPGGELTRRYGPFYEDETGLERSLYSWHYNFGKRGIVLDLDERAGQQQFLQLAANAAVVLDGRPKHYLAERGLGYEALKKVNAAIIVSRISPFGDEGPWSHLKGCDLVHLALGGVMMNCGYDPEPSGVYETPPIAPQMWQSYHIAGEMAAMAIMGALYHCADGGAGQYLSTAVHSAVAQQTELDIPSWIYVRQPHFRKTCRHSSPVPDPIVLAATKDGRYLFPYRSYAYGANSLPATISVLAKHGMAEDLLDPKYADTAYTNQAAVVRHIDCVVDRYIQSFLFERDVWREFQAAGLTWGPVRRPEENLFDKHWRSRQTFLEVERPEYGRSFTEVGAKWLCPQVSWRTGPRSPLLGEHTREICDRAELSTASAALAVSKTGNKSKRALEGVKFIDLGWMLASAGAGKFIAALGAEVVKVEHKSRWDTLRLQKCVISKERRKIRDAATAPMPDIKTETPNQSGFFHEINAGKRAISLNLKHPRGKEILTKLLRIGDVVAEGFSPGTMDRMGFGYEKLKQINPRLVYVQQSGMGQLGHYGEMRSYGPVAQAFSGISELSGLPEPFPPAGIGYSFLDWFGAYNMANAILAGLYRQKVTGQGCWIDSSQVETGTYLNGTAILDYSANGRRWSRYGNRSPYVPAAPHGVFRVRGTDRWLAIACFTEQEWHKLVQVLGNPAWSGHEKFATLRSRVAHNTELDGLIESATIHFEPYALQDALQAAGVPAGVCQTAEDRCDFDPQLKSMNWLIELPQSEVGPWLAKDFPVSMSDTPAHTGGVVGRHGPNYAEDNEYIYGEWLGFSTAQIREFEREDII